MTQLGQSGSASASELSAYFEQAAESARRYGVSISDLIGVTAEWSRMGYGLPDAGALAEAAVLYSHITGMDISASSEALVSTVQGLQLEAGEVKQLLDMLAGTGNDGMLESASGLRDLVENLTGFDIMEDSAGTKLKDLYSIVVGIGSEWQNLSASEQNGLLDALAGSQKDALGSVLDNVSAIGDAYASVKNASGAALKAQEKYEQGIRYSLDRLEASFQKFTDTLAGDGLLKGIADFGNGAVNVLDFITEKLGALGTLGAVGGTIGGAVAGAKGAGLT